MRPLRSESLGRSGGGATSRAARALVLALALAIAVHGRPACADEISPAEAAVAAPAPPEEPRVVLVTDHSDAALLMLLRAELRALGISVVEVERGKDDFVPADLRAAARSLGAVAAFRVLVSSGTVEVWIADRVTGKVVLREILAQGDGTRVNERVVVAQAIELLRASLMEIEAPHVSRGEVPAPQALAQVSGFPVERERFWLSLAPTAMWSPGGPGPSLGGSLGLGLRAWRFLGVAVDAGSAVMPSRLTRPSGTAEITTRWLGADVLALRPPGAGPWRPRAGLGAVAVFTALRGLAVAPRQGYDVTLVTMAPTLHADLGYAITKNLRVTAGVGLMVPLAFSTLVFEKETVGTYGRVLVLGTVGVEAALP